MLSLTPRKMKEIETQLREMISKRDRKVFLTVLFNVRSLEDTLTVPHTIMDPIRMEGIESVAYTNASNVITAMAQWKEFEVSSKIREIKKIPDVRKVSAEILEPLF
jgi:hypothetical protein